MVAPSFRRRSLPGFPAVLRMTLRFVRLAKRRSSGTGHRTVNPACVGSGTRRTCTACAVTFPDAPAAQQKSCGECGRLGIGRSLCGAPSDDVVGVITDTPVPTFDAARRPAVPVTKLDLDRPFDIWLLTSVERPMTVGWIETRNTGVFGPVVCPFD